MEYKIISGRTVEVRRCWMAVKRTAARRGMRVSKSGLRKISANEQEAVKRLAREINCNFSGGDLWVTLSYDNEHLPDSMESAKGEREKFLRTLRRKYKKATSTELRYIIATSGKDSKTGEPVRLHHHLLLPRDCEELIRGLWPSEDDVCVRHLDNRGDYTGVARYIVSNTDTGEDGGKKRYTCSKNLKKPVYTEPVEVREDERVRIPRDCSLKEKVDLVDEDTGRSSLYVRYTRAKNPDGHYVTLNRRI